MKLTGNKSFAQFHTCSAVSSEGLPDSEPAELKVWIKTPSADLKLKKSFTIK
jgi:hypothetical protein